MVLSVIKELIRQADPDHYSRYFEHNTGKPYCYSVYLPKPTLTPLGFKIAEPRLDITFSTAQWDDVALLHNGLLKVQENLGSEIRYKDLVLKIGRIILEKETKIHATTAYFKTLSPIVLRSSKPEKESVHKDLQVRLVQDGLARFNQELNIAMLPIIQQFLGRAATFQFKPVEGKFQETILRVHDEGTKPGVLFGHKGVFELSGDADVLNLLAQTGLGSRRGYGLGCLALQA